MGIAGLASRGIATRLTLVLVLVLRACIKTLNGTLRRWPRDYFVGARAFSSSNQLRMI